VCCSEEHAYDLLPVKELVAKLRARIRQPGAGEKVTSQMHREHVDVLIVGGGQAGAQIAIELHARKFSGTVLLLDSQLLEPYARPPLSKDFLAGKLLLKDLFFRPEGYWHSAGIGLALGETVVSVDPLARVARTASGRCIEYGKLVWAAGGSPRRLGVPGEILKGIHAVRTVSTVDVLRESISDDSRVVVVGGGYIGLETAAVLRNQGCNVTVVELEPRVLARVTGEAVSAHVEAVHRQAGVEVVLNKQVESFSGDNGNVRGVQLSGGAILPADVVLVGVGMVPVAEPLVTAGADFNGGIEVNEYCSTSLPDILAAGDCTRFSSKFAHGTRVRLESVQNAVGQARTVANVLLGTPKPYTDVPWFWSNQYDMKIKMAGLAHSHDATVVRGDPRSGSFSVIYLRGAALLAVDCVNATGDYAQGKWLIGRNAIARSPEDLASIDLPLKSLFETSPTPLP
jgi:3-phenylpropionate/trans-cinnamate dioxygenase ferredoxin reductase component